MTFSRDSESKKKTKNILTFPHWVADEKEIVCLIAAQGEVNTDYLCRHTEKPASQISGILTILEMKGWVRTAMGKIYIAKG